MVTSRCILFTLVVQLFLRLGTPTVLAWSSSTTNAATSQCRKISTLGMMHIHQSDSLPSPTRGQTTINRRKAINNILTVPFAATLVQTPIKPAVAYTPDSDKLRESLYLMSRVQEATAQQERFVNRATQQEVLKNKMKLTLRLVEKNYRLLDQITFAAEFVTPPDKVVDATTAGYESAEALQNAIDYVNSDLKQGPFEKGQKEYLTSNLQECRERLFDFLSYMPQTKLQEARKRVEEGE
jgi:hypothetical protein